VVGLLKYLEPGFWGACLPLLRVGPIGDRERISFIYILAPLTGVLRAVRHLTNTGYDRPNKMFVHINVSIASAVI